MGIRTDDLDFIRNKAAVKKDGVYTARGIAYRVKNGCVTHCLVPGGEVLEVFNHFTTTIAEVGLVSDKKAVLRKILKKGGE